MANASGALHFEDSFDEIPERQRRDRQHPPRIRRTPIDQEIVVRPQAFEGENRAPELEIAGGSEAADVGIQELGEDALRIDVLEAGLRVEARARNVVITAARVSSSS